MSEYLNSIAPNTSRNFFSDIMYNYGIGVKEFEEKTLLNRLIQIRRFFGYSMNVTSDMSQKEMQEEITAMFTDYELLMIKYPEGVPNKMKIITHSSNADKETLCSFESERQINISLCLALVKRTHIQTISLKDALVARILSNIELISAENARKALADELFWENIKKEFSKDVIPPF